MRCHNDSAARLGYDWQGGSDNLRCRQRHAVQLINIRRRNVLLILTSGTTGTRLRPSSGHLSVCCVRRQQAPDYHRGFGAELISEPRLGYLFGLEARMGIAKGVDPGGSTKIYLRAGRAF